MTKDQHSPTPISRPNTVADADVAKILARYGLSLAQFHALSGVVYAHDNPRAQRYHLLSPSCSMDPLLVDLERRGLINRMPRDPRIQPTDAGLRLTHLATEALNALGVPPIVV
jgi:DNA-binding MarR family transcriptional regulator